MCVFCAKQPEDFFLDYEGMGAIYNISPILPGHSLVIPKRHVESIFDLTEVELCSFMKMGRDLARLLTHVFETDAFNWAIQEKEASGQSVKHLHMHVVPRKLGDLANPGDWYQKLEENDLSEIDTFERFQLSHEQLSDLTERLRNRS